MDWDTSQAQARLHASSMSLRSLLIYHIFHNNNSKKLLHVCYTVGTVLGHPISSWPLSFVVLIPSLSVNIYWLQAGRQAGRMYFQFPQFKDTSNKIISLINLWNIFCTICTLLIFLSSFLGNFNISSEKNKHDNFKWLDGSKKLLWYLKKKKEKKTKQRKEEQKAFYNIKGVTFSHPSSV